MLLDSAASSATTETSVCSWRMEAGHARGHRAEERLTDDVRLVFARNHNYDAAREHDGLHAHRVRLARHVVRGLKKALVGLDGGLGQIDAVRALGEIFVRLVEADVPVQAHAEQLQVDAARGPDRGVVAGALALRVHLRAVRQVDAALRHVDRVEKVFVHEVVVALVMVSGQAAVLVEVEGGALAEVHLALVVPLDSCS